ncbi:MAG: hypothetical protein IK134_05770 [Oscillospiraceae bacterium]|nr:hypothetical protein [Oscillospiraceae bacterium]
MDSEILRALLENSDYFSEIAVRLDWKDAAVSHIEETKFHPRQWAFITAVRFPAEYVQTHFAEAYVQARITHLGCTEEWKADFYKDLTADEKRQHLQYFQSEYTEFNLRLSAAQAEDIAQEITGHCKNPAVAERILPLLKEGQSFYIGWYCDSISWDYLTISGDTIMIITLSVAA